MLLDFFFNFNMQKIELSPQKAFIIIDHEGDFDKLDDISDDKLNLFMPSLITGDLFNGNIVKRMDYITNEWSDITSRKSAESVFEKHKINKSEKYLILCKTGYGKSDNQD